MGSAQEVWVFSRTISRNTQRSSGEQAGRSRVDRLSGFQFAACPRIAKKIATTKDNLLHQSADMGLEPWANQRNGAVPRSGALHFSV